MEENAKKLLESYKRMCKMISDYKFKVVEVKKIR